MNQEEINKLKFRRQYLLSPEEIECPFLHQVRKIGKIYRLYTHIDLLVTEYSNMGISIILLGDMFDYESPKKGNLEIIKDLICENSDDLISKIHKYSGRFVIIYVLQDKMLLLHDASATRKIYYCDRDIYPWFSSQPHLLAKVLHLGKTTDESKLEYYNSEDFIRLFHSNIGDLTFYDEIRQVLPNHLYDVAGKRVIRYWPNKKIIPMPLSQAAESCATIIKGLGESIALRYRLMLPLTAGKDSRLILAATKDFRNEIFYYVNKERQLSEKDQDIIIPRLLLSKLGLEFHVQYPATSIDKDFADVYFENNRMASKEYLPFIYNYYTKFSDKINLPGNIASGGFEQYKYHKLQATPEALIKLHRIKKYSFALAYYTKWLAECKDTCIKNNVNILNLFYWEERLANWGTQIQLEKDIAQEDINLFNSRLLVTYYLSVNPKYILPPNFILHRKIIKNLWPEVLSVPINPGLKNSLKRILQYSGLLEQINRIRYWSYH
jgi:hypothetical protein